MILQNAFTKPVSTGVLWGIIGGLFLIVTSLLFTNGLLEIIPYPIILIAAMLTLKFRDKETKKFSKLFITGLLTFIIMSLVLYIYIIKFINPNSGINLLGHFWRFGLIIGLGIVSSSILSFIFNWKK